MYQKLKIEKFLIFVVISGLYFKILDFYQKRQFSKMLGIAFSEDLYRWEKVDTPILKHGNAGEIDELHAHKPCVIEKDGTLYHFYCAVRESREKDKAVNIDPTQEEGEEKTEYRCISVATKRA